MNYGFRKDVQKQRFFAGCKIESMQSTCCFFQQHQPTFDRTANGKPRETLHEAACYGNVTLRFRIVNLIIADASCTINVNPA